MTRQRAKNVAQAAIERTAKLDLAVQRRPPGEVFATGPLYSERLAQAFAFATERHGRQLRRGTSIPYVTHPIAVCALVGEHGGTEDEMIAALLHDTVEDTGGIEVLEQIRRRFGDQVADLVKDCSDDTATRPEERAPWLARKTRYLEHIACAAPGLLRISIADKLHNLDAIAADLEHEGPSVFDRFGTGRDGVVWYYGALVEVLGAAVADENDNGLTRLCERLRDRYARLQAVLATR
jgi:(p)ppGpp synthase/HD superfamily hydrolase